jgi:hypothetical protein
MGASIRSNRSVRFSDKASVSDRIERDFSRWPGVYVHPGQFRHAADRPEDQDAWKRCRDRYRRWRDRRHNKRAERSHRPGAERRISDPAEATTKSHGKRR